MPADHPQYLLWGADQGDLLAPGTGDFSINHKLAQLLGLAHAQWLKLVASFLTSHHQLTPGLIAVKMVTFL